MVLLRAVSANEVLDYFFFDELFFDPEDFFFDELFFDPEDFFFDPEDFFFEELFVRPSSARCLFTVRAAISFARFVERPWSFSESLTCSYCRSSLLLHAFGIAIVSFTSSLCNCRAHPRIHCRSMSEDLYYRGWRRPGPTPPGNVDCEAGETLDFIVGNFRIFQYEKGHRYSTDDVLVAWYGTIAAPRVEKAADLGSGIGSVATIAAWRLPGARFTTVEAQEISFRLAQKSVRFNGLDTRFDLRLGDLRDFAPDDRFDLVLGSPPYFPPGSATAAAHPQAVPARIEVRGTVADYARTAARILAPGGVFAFVFPTLQDDRALRAIGESGLKLVRSRDVVFKEGEAPLITLYAASPASDLPASYESWSEPPLTIRMRDGSVSPEYSAVRLSIGIPPGNVAKTSDE